jgi:phage baseplate assembly protein W
MAINSVRTFRDLDLNFRKNPATKDVATRVGDQAVIRSIRNLLHLGNYEKPFHPEIGSQLRKMLFENMTSLSAQHVKQAVKDVITNFEPRAQLRDVVVQNRDDLNAFQVSISFYIVNNATPTQIDVFLERVR